MISYYLQEETIRELLIVGNILICDSSVPNNFVDLLCSGVGVFFRSHGTLNVSNVIYANSSVRFVESEDDLIIENVNFIHNTIGHLVHASEGTATKIKNVEMLWIQ